MKQSIFTILSNTPLTDCVYKMVLSGDTSAITAPGQFVNIQITGKFLRRPISVCDYDGDTLTIVYKVVGKGTEILSRMVPEEKLDILTGLGNGYAHAAVPPCKTAACHGQAGNGDSGLQHPIGSVL